MNSPVKLKKPVTPDEDVLESNPWLKITPPYSKLYKKYKKVKGNKYMVAIYLLCDPDDDPRDGNPFAKMSEDEAKETIENNYTKVDWNCPIVQECIDKYPFDCLTEVQTNFKAEKEKLIERGKFIRANSYKLVIPKEGEEFNKDIFNAQKDIIVLVEKMMAATAKIYESYIEAEEKLFNEKSDSQFIGNRMQTNREKGLI
jgi:hypothetical protein